MDSFSSSHVGKKGSISMNHVFQKGSILWVMLKKKFNAESHVQKRVNHFWVILLKKKVSIPWSKLKSSISRVTKKFQTSWSQIIFKKVQFFESFCEEGSFNSFSPLVKRIQFFESKFWKSGSIVEVTFKKSSILWVVFKKNVQFCGSEKCSIESPKKWVQFFASWKRRRRLNSFSFVS